MELKRKVEILEELGNVFSYCVDSSNSSQFLNEEVQQIAEDLKSAISRAQHENGWFTEESVTKSMEAWARSLQAENIENWLRNYQFSDDSKTVGLILAGNVPFVGLHDALCVLLSEHKLKAKLSSKDQLLMGTIINALKQIEPSWNDKIELNVPLKGIDLLIATGSDNSARYFDYYFKDVEKIIRKNRTSVAIVTKDDNSDSLAGLADDVFTHFGLGCRNVTKVFVPKDYNLDQLFGAFYKYRDVANLNKYANNYDYNKAVYLLNKIELIENGFLLLKEDEGLHSPVGVLFYEYYNNLEELSLKLNLYQDKIQCKVASIDQEGFIPFGKAQQPELWDYSDGVDTLKFLN